MARRSSGSRSASADPQPAAPVGRTFNVFAVNGITAGDSAVAGRVYEVGVVERIGSAADPAAGGRASAAARRAVGEKLTLQAWGKLKDADRTRSRVVTAISIQGSRRRGRPSSAT
jgi:hypothetical protein